MEERQIRETGKKIWEGSLKEADFDVVFEVFAQVCNTDDILTFTLKGYSESFLFYFDEYSYGITFEKGVCRSGKGMLLLPDVTFRIHKATALDILNGRVYSAVAHMNGDVDYTGYKDGAVRFAGILENVLDAVWNVYEPVST